ncbi:MAG: RNA-guided endonuclease InsQ/TnpB family protein [Alphaproteobacteria bacterium]
MLTRRITFRLYPNKSQAAKLFEMRRLHCTLYNSAVADRKDSYQKLGKSIGYFDQQNRLPEFKKVWPEFVGLGSQALQATLKRVDLAFSSFFKGLRGYPRFKSIRNYSGWTYPASSGWKVETAGKNGSLQLSNVGRIQMRGEARTWGTPTTCTIVYRHGKWYASITVQCIPARTTGEGAIGLDLGCKEAVTFSDGLQVSKPVFISEGERAVKLASKQLRRKRAPNRNNKIKASRRFKKVQRQISKLRRKVGRQRLDWMHKLASDTVSRNSLISGEKLSVKNMTRKAKKGSKRKRQKTGLNRSILEVGMSSLSKMFAYKAAEAGGFYVESPTRTLKPTQRCAVCWELTPKTLSDRIHQCSNTACGHNEDRDVNAAQVNLIWARGQELSSTGVDGSALLSSPVNTGGFKQLSQVKRQKPPVASR